MRYGEAAATVASEIAAQPSPVDVADDLADWVAEARARG
ncbi:hypothetical protein SAMN05421810_102599 [Amycolatopsis arida]|uniref:Uncharacterized protein n=1 Tax=Amycolatopsis arida TaxID=587909 RepID=A0A1I5QDT8_9PSEU|nr:hypothetical protein CLV69_101600 [Amycolatopsis arida]SFP44435.1 hypothetical protein SAMN05421810_102599 [Amycolatopsis arida]